MKVGSWPSIFGIYLFGVCGASTVSKIIPLTGDIGGHFGLAAANFGWLVALIAVPAALFAIPSGIVVDRIGAKLVLQLAALLGIAANLVYYFSPSLQFIQVARVMEGLAIVHIYTAGPAMLMVSTEGDKRTRAMTLWSTYAPVGTATGLMLGGMFAESEGWRTTFLVHGTLYAVASLLGLLQPKVVTSMPGQAASLNERVGELGKAFLRPMLLLLSLAFFLIISMGLGANVTFPGYLAMVHQISAQASSSMVATTTLAMIIGSLGVGYFLTNGIRPPVLYTGLAILGFVAGVLCFYPGLSIPMRYVSLIGWFVLTGAALATIMAMLPMVSEPSRRGSAAALTNFAGAAATFVNPPLWLGISSSGHWTPFIGLLAIGWTGSVLLLWSSAILLARSKKAKVALQA